MSEDPSRFTGAMLKDMLRQALEDLATLHEDYKRMRRDEPEMLDALAPFISPGVRRISASLKELNAPRVVIKVAVDPVDMCVLLDGSRLMSVDKTRSKRARLPVAGAGKRPHKFARVLLALARREDVEKLTPREVRRLNDWIGQSGVQSLRLHSSGEKDDIPGAVTVKPLRDGTAVYVVASG